MELCFAVNTMGPLFVTQGLLPNLRLSDTKKVINISTRSSQSGGTAYGYRVSKAALNTLTRCMAKDKGMKDFILVAIAPGHNKTDMGTKRGKLDPVESIRKIKQLIEVNRIDRSNGEVAYQFTDGTKIKKIFVSPLLHSQLSKGLIAIVRLHDQYELVPVAVADKISQRDESIVIVQNQVSKDETDEDDYYADFKIPDDLMW